MESTLLYGKAKDKKATKGRKQKVLEEYRKVKKIFKKAEEEGNPELYQKALRKAKRVIDALVNVGEHEKYDDISIIIETSRNFLNKQKIRKKEKASPY